MGMGERERFEAALLRSNGHDAVRIAEGVVDWWARVGDALGPIIGRGGVAALLQRCLHQTGQSYVWLRQVLGTHPLEPIDLPSLEAVFARQTPAEAAAAGAVLFHQFHALLASLIGSALSERLMHDVHVRLPGEGTSQDF